MSYRIETRVEGIDWEKVKEVIGRAGLAVHSTELIETAFKNSYLTVFVFDGGTLIGTGRAISDGAYQAGIYDIAVLPEYQGRGIGQMIMKKIHEGLEGMNIILYAKPSARGFYERLGYSKMLTGMAKFKAAERMREKGFIE